MTSYKRVKYQGRPTFSQFQSHLDLAHKYWEEILKQGGWAIDATCGNGHDTLFLAQAADGVIGLDIQENALQITRSLLKEAKADLEKVHLFCQSHETFPLLASNYPIPLIVYNLGYLPGGNKDLTTQTDTTLKSISNGLSLLVPGGALSITCYPGHPEGEKEEKAIGQFAQNLPPHIWSVCFHQWKNRKQSPSLFLIQKKIM